MKRIVIVLIVGLVSFWFGYWINEMKGFANGIREDAERLKNLKGPIEVKENFDDFILKFTADSLFQMERIKFPLKSGHLDELDGVETILIQKHEWKMVRLFRQDRQQIYSNYKRELIDTDERMIWYGGLDSGKNKEYKFQRLDGLWYLIEYNNLST